MTPIPRKTRQESGDKGLNYVGQNPVEAGLVDTAEMWLWGSSRRRWLMSAQDARGPMNYFFSRVDFISS